jgi:hypothetical protein
VQNKILNFESAYLATASLSTVQGGGNLMNCSVTTLTPGGVGFTGTQPYVIMKHMRVLNTLASSAVTINLYKGATVSSAGGTQFAWGNVSLPAQSYLDWVGQERFDSADFLTGYANLPNSVVIEMNGEIGLS